MTASKPETDGFVLFQFDSFTVVIVTSNPSLSKVSFKLTVLENVLPLS